MLTLNSLLVREILGLCPCGTPGTALQTPFLKSPGHVGHQQEDLRRNVGMAHRSNLTVEAAKGKDFLRPGPKPVLQPAPKPVLPPPIFVYEDKAIKDGIVEKIDKRLPMPRWPTKTQEEDRPLVTKPGHRSGYVALVGLPNAGKSTLLNRLVGQKLSIVTQKPQTTRHRILGICSEEDYQMILYDTPGLLEKEILQLDRVMMQNVRTAAINADCVVVVVDITEEPEKMAKAVKDGVMGLAQGRPTLLVLNKCDLLDSEEVQQQRAEWYKDNGGFETVMVASARDGRGANDIKAWVVERLPHGPTYYPKEMVSEHPERFFVAEIVREKLFLQYRQEVPYSCQVNVINYVERTPPNKDFIAIDIIAEKESQKGILLGKGGAALKALATASRLDIEDFVGREVYLEMRVKIEKDWREDDKLIQTYGLDASRTKL